MTFEFVSPRQQEASAWQDESKNPIGGLSSAQVEALIRERLKACIENETVPVDLVDLLVDLARYIIKLDRSVEVTRKEQDNASRTRTDNR
jgi:hypothetical protein